uniref:Uncharacterized protein n=1 Tax=Melopsittacus undulatus TaxID=13146 RepID=A0A8C6INE6_MELUD
GDEADGGEDAEEGCPSPQVFRVEVLCNGRRHTVVKRYSEFQALHKRIKKTCKVPDFPPRHVPNWMPKVLEQRRQGLELYIQGVLYHNKELPQDVLDFLKLRSGPKTSRGNGTFGSPECVFPFPELAATQLQLLLFPAELFPDTILSGVLQGLYLPPRSTPSQAVP